MWPFKRWYQLNTPVSLLKQDVTVKFRDGTLSTYALYEYCYDTWDFLDGSNVRYRKSLSDLQNELENSILKGTFYNDRKGLKQEFYSAILFKDVAQIQYHNITVYDTDETVIWIKE